MKLKPFTVTLHLRGLECQRCGHRWVPRIADVRICPKCKSARWDEPKRRHTKEGGNR